MTGRIGRIVHISLGKEMGGLPEIIRAEIRAANDEGLKSEWISVDLDARYSRASAAVSAWLHDVPAPDPIDPIDASDQLLSWGESAAPVINHQLHDGDVVILHDPVPAFLAPFIPDGRLCWRSHIGTTAGGDNRRKAAASLNPVLEHVRMAMFYNLEYAWTDIPAPVVEVGAVLPDDDPKLSLEVVRTNMASDLLVRGEIGGMRLLDEHGTGFLPDARTPFVTQVARWDPMKGQARGMHCTSQALQLAPDAHAVFAGPRITSSLLGSVNRSVLESLLAFRATLNRQLRSRIHIWEIAGATQSERPHRQAVNIIRRSARAVLSPSLEEGWGLAAAESLHVGCVVVASPVGGHLRQIADGHNGYLRDFESPASVRTIAELMLTNFRNDVADRARRTSRLSNRRAQIQDQIAALEAWVATREVDA